ncbi:hypothetical protein ASF99_09180 [Exiguobacterium sp. Leaf187]|uniref:LITAF-like zinc ribbon domain-containing protein n=1 Tax=Exiguobacterium sp. Leaf187 TaxID=1736294 RepID=UPI0006FCC9F0|nr:LITAF-like zinc ribbon domain-containing protein [Exiguobacterium sp. Leaf187]KQS20046.1 hypothetical protein ASF99_09180 [Exiguobacterium sp. Leaf187]
MSHCSNCQTPMNDQMIYCPVCGQKNHRTRSRSSKKSWFIGLLLLMLCIGGGTFGYLKYQAAQPLFKTSELTRSAADVDQVLPEGFSSTQRNQLTDDELEDFLTFDTASPDSLYHFLSTYAERLPSIGNETGGDWEYYDSSLDEYIPYADLFYGDDDLTEDERESFGNRLAFSEESPTSHVALQNMTFDVIKAIDETHFHVEATETYDRRDFDMENQPSHRASVEYEITFDDELYYITSIKRTFKKEATS